MRLERLTSIGPREIAVRSRQEFSKWIDRILPPAARLVPLGEAAAPSAGTGRGFFGGVESPVVPALFESRMGVPRAQLLAAARRFAEGRFDLLGYVELDFGGPIDWHLDPVSGRKAPLRHWSRIDPLDTDLGDPKVIWELNRHQWLVTLAQAHRLTGDDTFAQAAVAAVRSWIPANPAERGINWTSSLEVALRLISWCWTLRLLDGARPLTPGLQATMRRWMRLHARHIERYLSTFSSPNTHLTGEALGLFYAGAELHEAPEAERWRSLGARILESQIGSQVFDDGVYFEQSTCYQQYTIEIYLHYLLLAERLGLEVAAAVPERLQAMLDFLYALRQSDGGVPRIGDGDGGRLLPLHRRATRDLRGLFAVAAARFGRGDYHEAADGVQPETLWMLGPEGLDAQRRLVPAPPTGPASRLFAEGGYVVMRGGHGRGEHALVFDVGPLGPGPSAGHAHADLLSVQVDPFGDPGVVDPGTYRYAVDPVWREHLRGTAAHATITVDCLGQSVPAGPFAWGGLPRARLRRFLSNEAVDFADASHDAYRRLADPVTHRRRVLFVKPFFFIVVDDLEGNEAHRIEARFPLAAERAENRCGWVRLQTASRKALDLRAFAGIPLERLVIAGGRPPVAGWSAPEYGRVVPAPALILSAWAQLPLRLLTLLVPNEEEAQPPDVVVRTGPGGTPQGVVLWGGRFTVLFEQEAVVVNGRRHR
ncbi:MAG TPA: alginate lyase family protein [Candidatus Polarisedimenticolia bacterium]|jgi:uncharacterized heparinase superfamily protein|nr:alginate lyase family protein [Candidatus Polarisedimenticolia bacterium]